MEVPRSACGVVAIPRSSATVVRYAKTKGGHGTHEMVSRWQTSLHRVGTEGGYPNDRYSLTLRRDHDSCLQVPGYDPAARRWWERQGTRASRAAWRKRSSVAYVLEMAGEGGRI